MQVIEDSWNNGDFAILKVDIRNAFNLVSQEAAPTTMDTWGHHMLTCYFGDDKTQPPHDQRLQF